MRNENLIYVVGQNITSQEATSLIRQGQIEQLEYKNSNGAKRKIPHLYIQAGLPHSVRIRLIQENAIRIFNALHEGNDNLMLVGSCAIHMRPISNAITVLSSGGVFMPKIVSGALRINYGTARTTGAFTANRVWQEDAIGRFRVNVMPDEGLFLQSFQKSRTQSKLSISDQCFLLDRIVEREGGITQAWQAINAMFKILRQSESTRQRALYFINNRHLHERSMEPDDRMDVRLGKIRIGEIHRFSNKWAFHKSTSLPLMSFMRDQDLVKGNAMPVFLESLLPENQVKVDDASRGQLYRMFYDDVRYLNNIVIHGAHEFPEIILDRHDTNATLNKFSHEGVFTGVCQFETSSTRPSLKGRIIETALMANLPYIPGMQDKVACHLTSQGELSLAKDKPFTHILKFSGSSDHSISAVSEWACMTLLQGAGIKTAEFALVNLEGVGPCFLTERFDISNEKEKRVTVFEDFCSVMNIPIHRKYDGATLKQIMREILRNSVNPKIDGEQFFRQVVASFIVGNMDGHTRNFGLVTSVPEEKLKTNGRAFENDKDSVDDLEIRLAPAFDVLCTIALPYVSKNPALLIDKGRNYRNDDFLFLAKEARIEPEDAQRIMNETHADIKNGLEALTSRLPGFLEDDIKVIEHLNQIRTRIARSAIDVVRGNCTVEIQEEVTNEKPRLRL